MGQTTIKDIEKALKKYWGYESFMPLQEQAMECVVSGIDSVVVLPTGGGKSLCFQAPAVSMSGLAVVVSPLISLMKDQVDTLTECGVPAARLDSTQSLAERKAIARRIRQGELKLLYLAPERLISDGFLEFLKGTKISFIAVDEAHCVSMWGHDFRPEYRELGVLKEALAGAAIHAYTATATEKVRADIAEQLGLDNPKMLVGSFDRPNLVYKVQRRRERTKQICAVLDRHKGESGIIYCIRRADVDEMCVALRAGGYNVAGYHAGMAHDQRKRTQDAFLGEKVDTIIATVAFGMGIDKSNVRYVIHSGMPKSLEHYQQESGRAGRDGLEAECCLFYSGGDYGIWTRILQDTEPQAQDIALAKLNSIYKYCTGVTCRHKAIVNYFGQDLGGNNCAACDVCLGDLHSMKDSLATAQKILSCIMRLDQRFGGDYTALVLTGSREQRILDNAHHKLSTYSLLSDFTRRIVRDWIEQLAAQGYIQKTGDYNVLNVTATGWRILKGKETPCLLQPGKKPAKLSKVAKESWEGVDRGLFEALRELRRKVANERAVPAYIVFGDATLRDMARRRPTTDEAFLEVNGVGEKKRKQFGSLFMATVKEYCTANSLASDLLCR